MLKFNKVNNTVNVNVVWNFVVGVMESGTQKQLVKKLYKKT